MPHSLPAKGTKRIGMVARWRPVHRGQAVVLRNLSDHAEQLLIGIGSANRYNYRNPFTLQETMDMLHLALADCDNVMLLPIDDLDDGPRWAQMVREQFGPLDLFVTANAYVGELMRTFYPVEHPVSFVPAEQRVPITGTQVRLVMARGEAWEQLVPDAVANYLKENGLDERFRREFGLQTLAAATTIQSD
ncbi:MAG: hypothetical protein GYB68_11385 [Chloroflexi bacterium]|nr:hypothetical protein [Chloroflexota bacterium]